MRLYLKILIFFKSKFSIQENFNALNLFRTKINIVQKTGQKKTAHLNGLKNNTFIHLKTMI